MLVGLGAKLLGGGAQLVARLLGELAPDLLDALARLVARLLGRPLASELRSLIGGAALVLGDLHPLDRLLALLDGAVGAPPRVVGGALEARRAPLGLDRPRARIGEVARQAAHLAPEVGDRSCAGAGSGVNRLGRGVHGLRDRVPCLGLAGSRREICQDRCDRSSRRLAARLAARALVHPLPRPLQTGSNRARAYTRPRRP